jgi:transposase InsO family protein
MKLGFSTLEGWYYAAKNEKKDPVGRLRSKTRSDLGKSRGFSDAVAERLTAQYARYPHWSYQLHADNLRVAVLADARLGAPPSYPTVRRYMKQRGMRKQAKPKSDAHAAAINRREGRDVQSYEMEFVNALWHLDFHGSPLRIVDDAGNWHVPEVLGVFDDHSRYCGHMQWYLSETTDDLVHAFGQALLKRGIPRALLKDNGSAMISAEFQAGLTRLGIDDARTWAHSPYQNGKCEFAWTKVDGRLMAMLEGQKDLTLSRLNDITQAWVEMEYNRQVHRETGERPVDRLINGKDVGRPSPSPELIRLGFRREVKRRVRRSDCTISLATKRFEIPSRFRSFDDVTVRYATWDLAFVHLVDPRSGEELCRIYPLDKAKNAEGHRRLVENPVVVARPEPTKELPPLLNSLVEQYAALGLKPAYLPKPQPEKDPR